MRPNFSFALSNLDPKNGTKFQLKEKAKVSGAQEELQTKQSSNQYIFFLFIVIYSLSRS